MLAHTYHLSYTRVARSAGLWWCPTLMHDKDRSRNSSFFYGWHHYRAFKNKDMHTHSHWHTHTHTHMHSLGPDIKATGRRPRWDEPHRPCSATGDKQPTKTFKNLGYWHAWIYYAAFLFLMWEGDTVIWSWGKRCYTPLHSITWFPASATNTEVEMCYSFIWIVSIVSANINTRMALCLAGIIIDASQSKLL